MPRHGIKACTAGQLLANETAKQGTLPACCNGQPPCASPPARRPQRKRAQEMTRAQMEVEGRAGGPGAPGTEGGDPHFALPPSLLRRYEVGARTSARRGRGPNAQAGLCCESRLPAVGDQSCGCPPGVDDHSWQHGTSLSPPHAALPPGAHHASLQGAAQQAA